MSFIMASLSKLKLLLSCCSAHQVISYLVVPNTCMSRAYIHVLEDISKLLSLVMICGTYTGFHFSWAYSASQDCDLHCLLFCQSCDGQLSCFYLHSYSWGFDIEASASHVIRPPLKSTANPHMFFVPQVTSVIGILMRSSRLKYLLICSLTSVSVLHDAQLQYSLINPMCTAVVVWHLMGFNCL